MKGKDWSLPVLLEGLHNDIEEKLRIARKSFGHPVSSGDASEAVWIKLLESYLPKRYKATKATVVDSKGKFSQQIDVLIYDRQYTPFIFKFKKQLIVPAEAVYAAFEAKQSVNAAQIRYAKRKIASVRKLHRTSLPVPTVSGMQPAKKPGHILGGFLSFESDWAPPLGSPLASSLKTNLNPERLDLGCVAAHGTFSVEPNGTYEMNRNGKPATAFLFELIARLQSTATVPMIDVRAYSSWLA